MPLFAKRTAKVSELIPQLYLHGLSEDDLARRCAVVGSDGGATEGEVER